MSAAAFFGSASIIFLCLLLANVAYAHGVQGGFYGRQPNAGLALPMLGASAFGIIADLVRRIGFVLSSSLLLGSSAVFALTMHDLITLGLQLDSLDSLTRTYYDILQYLISASLIGLFGGLVFTAYYFLARRPYIKYKVRK